MRLSAVLSASLAAGLAVAGAQALAQQSFDGRWSVEVVTEQGDCDRAFRYLVAIEGGRVRYAGAEDFDISGRVSSTGRVQGRISRGTDTVSVTGRLEQAWGSGTWNANRGCSGRWRAERRG